MLVPTWLHFGSQNQPKSRLGGFLGRLADILGRLRAPCVGLGASWDGFWVVLKGFQKKLIVLGGFQEGFFGVGGGGGHDRMEFSGP